MPTILRAPPPPRLFFVLIAAVAAGGLLLALHAARPRLLDRRFQPPAPLVRVFVPTGAGQVESDVDYGTTTAGMAVTMTTTTTNPAAGDGKGDMQQPEAAATGSPATSAPPVDDRPAAATPSPSPLPSLYPRGELSPQAKEFFAQVGPFDQRFKNPCWWANSTTLRPSNTSAAFYCLPYYYLLGMPKSGSSALYHMLTRLPNVRVGRSGGEWEVKEPPYWQKGFSEDIRSEYCERSFGTAAAWMAQSSAFLDIVGDHQPDNAWAREPVPLTAQRALRMEFAEIIHTLTPKARLILVLREPAARSFSAFKYFPRMLKPLVDEGLGTDVELLVTPEIYNLTVHRTLDAFATCLAAHAFETCIHRYELLQLPGDVLRGVYVAWVRYWLSFFPREQLLVLRSEDLHSAHVDVLQRVASFLDLPPLRPALMAELKAVPPAYNLGPKRVDAFPETLATLRRFFAPYNAELAELVGDNSFLWLD